MFLADFKKCVYEESSVTSFDKMWTDLLVKGKCALGSFL
jgi:hypothetical protein